jgi:hypothetical protein
MKLKLILAAILCVGLAAAKETRGTILGRVLDPSGAPVAGASVIVGEPGYRDPDAPDHERNGLLRGKPSAARQLSRFPPNIPASNGRCAAGSSSR